MNIELESCEIQSTRRPEDVGIHMPWLTEIVITVRSRCVVDDLSPDVANRIGMAAVRQYVDELGSSK